MDCVNDGKQLCQRFNIQGYPTIKLFKYGQYVGDYVGQRDRGKRRKTFFEFLTRTSWLVKENTNLFMLHNIFAASKLRSGTCKVKESQAQLVEVTLF